MQLRTYSSRAAAYAKIRVRNKNELLLTLYRLIFQLISAVARHGKRMHFFIKMTKCILDFPSSSLTGFR